MPFNYLLFWAGFLCLWVLGLCVWRNVRARNLLLLMASYVIYFKISGSFAGLLAVSTVVTFLLARALPRHRFPRILLCVGILFHVLILSYFKYLNFFASELSAILPFRLDWPTEKLILPLGISFYTFQAIGYLLDVYWRKYQPSRSLLDFALFIAFFPKVVAGPLERADHLLPQLGSPQRPSLQMTSEGIYLIVWGLLKKSVIAENARLIADRGFDHPSGSAFFLILAAIAFTLQIYADFSGYSDIAKGMARLLGFDLVWNFDMPYLAATPSEFWRRWHISLSDWFRDYVYIPLGGNRRGTWAAIRNVLITMVLVGLWHGANWTYMLWGLYCGLLLVAYRLASIPLRRFRHYATKPLLRLPLIALFFTLTIFGWAIFRSESLEQLLVFLKNISFAMTDRSTHWLLLLLWAPIILVEAYQLHSNDRLVIARASAAVQAFFYGAAFYALLLLPPLSLSDFIYAQF